MVQEYVSLLPVSGTAFLVDGWEFYPDRLLTPGDFSVQTPSPRYTVWAGEYPNLALFHTDGNPYGAATYRLRLKGEGMMSLYLQEPLCAARVFVDGKDLGGSGSVGGADVIGGTGSTDMAHGAAGGYQMCIRDSSLIKRIRLPGHAVNHHRLRVLIPGLRRGGKGIRQRQLLKGRPHLDRLVSHCFVPVSYTHLDVYKRQP